MSNVSWDQRYKRPPPKDPQPGRYYPKNMATTWTRKFRRTPMSAHLDQHGGEINARFEWMQKAESDLDYYRINIGLMLLDAQALVRQRLGPGKWVGWCRKTLHRSQRDISRLMKLASAEYPLEAQRAVNEGKRIARAVTAAQNRASMRDVPDTQDGTPGSTFPGPQQSDAGPKVVPFRRPVDSYEDEDDDDEIGSAVATVTTIFDRLSDNQCRKVMQELEAYLKDRSKQHAS